ncbi:hypothetical protein COCOBI_04-0790 [Coccomyxa sp. Obi]|nr:hypothetical protein COCOBI_04-0790 [Coccomyxa sp. Obi]
MDCLFIPCICGTQPETVALTPPIYNCPVCQGMQCVQLLRNDEHCCFFFLPFGKCAEGTPHYQCLRCGTVMPGTAPMTTAYPPPGSYPPR